MAFQKGQPRPVNAGRKQGVENKKKLQKIAEFLADKDISPILEILKILENENLSPKAKIESWFELQSYCEAKPKAADESSIQVGIDEFDDIPNSEFLKLIKHPGTA
jgi:hypothetical protein